jgi:hypothetical protein
MEDGKVSRRNFLAGSGATIAASTFLSSIPKVEAGTSLVDYIIRNMSPDKKVINYIVSQIAQTKSADKLLMRRMSEHRPDLDNNTIVNYIFYFDMKKMFDIAEGKNKHQLDHMTLFGIRRLLPGIVMQESALDISALSSSLAEGLGQVTPIAKRDAMRKKPVLATFMNSKNIDPLSTVSGTLDVMLELLDENYPRYIRSAFDAFADSSGISQEKLALLHTYLIVNTYNAGHVPIKAILNWYTDNLSTNKIEQLQSMTPIEIFIDISLSGYNNRHDINGAGSYGRDAVTYVPLVLGSAVLAKREIDTTAR